MVWNWAGLTFVAALNKVKKGGQEIFFFRRLQDFSKDRGLSDILDQQNLQEDIQDHPAHLSPDEAWLDQL